jgi:ribosome-associated protein
MKPPVDSSDYTAHELGPSKSARKRAALDAQRLGERLVGLPDAELAALALPESLADAIRAARGITSRAAGARQRQYIGKLMRAHGSEQIRAALAEHDRHRSLEAQRDKRIGNWRARLLREGRPALEELLASHPRADRATFERLTTAARAAPQAARVTAARDLFRALRELLAAP